MQESWDTHTPHETVRYGGKDSSIRYCGKDYEQFQERIHFSFLNRFILRRPLTYTSPEKEGTLHKSRQLILRQRASLKPRGRKCEEGIENIFLSFSVSYERTYYNYAKYNYILRTYYYNILHLDEEKMQIAIVTCVWPKIMSKCLLI